MQRLPRASLFVLTDTDGVLARPTKRCLASRSWIGVTNVSLDETNATTDRRVGAPAFAERIRLTIDLNLMPYWTIDDEHHCRPASGCLQCIKIKFWFGDGFDSGDKHRHVFRFAASHDGVDGNFLHSSWRPLRWHRADYLIPVAPSRA